MLIRAIFWGRHWESDVPSRFEAWHASVRGGNKSEDLKRLTMPSWHAERWRCPNILNARLEDKLKLAFTPGSPLAELRLGGLVKREDLIEISAWYIVMGWRLFQGSPGANLDASLRQH